MSLLAIVGIGLIVAGLVALVALYDTLVRRRNAVEQATGSVAAHLKQRFDLIPTLVDTTKAHMDHERELFQTLATLRERSLAPNLAPGDLAALDAASRAAIGGLVVRAESYPTLGSSQSFVAVQRSLRQVEEQLAAARRAYNSAVVDLNNSIDVFPNRPFAALLGFQRGSVFQVAGHEAQPPDVQKLFKNRS